MPQEQHTVYYELHDALGEEGCAICTLALRGLRRFLDGLAYESVNNIGLRAELRAARGFCAPHGQLLKEARSALGMAIIHRDILGSLHNALEGIQPRTTLPLPRRFGGGNAAQLKAALAPKRACPACERRREAELIYLDTLAQHAHEQAFLERFQASTGLCAPHLRSALGRITRTDAFNQLRSAQLAIWSRLNDELDEFIRKHDHQFAHEPVGAEATAWSRAVLLTASHPALGRTPDED